MIKPKLLLHVGYPKTGTTTLQEAVFLELHNLGLINYLGRTVSSTHTSSGRSNFSGLDLAVKLRKHFIYAEPVNFTEGLLAHDKINVLSDEDLTFHWFYTYARFGVTCNPLEFPGRLKKMFGDAVDVGVVITLRNQPDLIHSCFVQKYRFVYESFGELSFSSFLGNLKPGLDSKHLELYDFNLLANSYINSFKNSIKVLLFEDFVHDKSSFWAQLGDTLCLDSRMLEDLAGSKHLRNKEKLDNKIITHVTTSSLPGRLLQLLFGKGRFNEWLVRRHYLRNSRWLQLEKRMLLNSKKLILPSLKAEERSMIKDHFKDSNKRFANEFNLDQDKMERYGYF